MKQILGFSVHKLISVIQVRFDDMDISGTILTLPNQLSLYFEYQKGNYLPMASIVEEHNQNYSQAQKESLQWHWTLEYCGFQ